MSIIEILRSIFINIRGNKVKVFLTTLGIIVGALTIVLVISIGEGSQASVEEQFKSLNVGTIQIMAGGFGRQATVTLTMAEMEAIKEEAQSIKKVSMVISGSGNISYYNTSTSATLTGVTEDIMEINNLVLEYGEFLTEEHNDYLEKVVVLGYNVAELFFEEDISAAVGEKVTINGKRYDVIGVLKRQGDNMLRGISDDSVLVPYQVAEKYITGRNVRPNIVALAVDINHVSSAIEEVTSIFQKAFRDKSDQIVIIDAGSRLQSAKDSARTMTLMLLSVATVVLVVGGIGIMNVLFVSVKERTKEIGILKAIGARRRDILLIFLIEAIIISAAGGVIGILGSMLVMPVLNYFEVRVIPSLFGYLLAFAFSVGIGTFFGYYPAAKAAALKPIDALNYE